jgi:hypothetical protein
MNAHEDDVQAGIKRAKLSCYLQIWGHWHRQMLIGGLGYAPNPLAQMIKLGIVVRGEQMTEVPINEIAEKMDSTIRILLRHNAKLAHALYAYYTGLGSLKERAKALDISETCLTQRVTAARQWLIGWFAREHT